MTRQGGNIGPVFGRRISIPIVGGVALVLVLAGALILSGGDGDGSSDEQERVEANGLSVAYPSGWNAAEADLTAVFVNELAIGTYRLESTPRSSCPVRAFESLGKRDALIMIWEMGSGDLSARPDRFGDDLDWSSRVLCAEYAGRGTVRVLHFRENGRAIHVWLVVGRDAPAERRSEAYRILDSLKVDKR